MRKVKAKGESTAIDVIRMEVAVELASWFPQKKKPGYIWWEQDYINELFPEPYFRIVNESDHPGVIICNHKKQIPSIEQILKIHKNIHMMVHLSDEFMGLNKPERACENLYHRFKLVIRQHAYYKPEPPNVLHIPLGYFTNMLLSDNNKIHHNSRQYTIWSLSVPSSQRKFKWSFIGSAKGKDRKDRILTLNAFQQWSPYFMAGNLTTAAMRHMYNQSLFVIVGRGHYSTDCFRIYEAIISGAIPVVVVPSEKELNFTYSYQGHWLPVITAPTPIEAVNICQNMSDLQIDIKRVELARWYIERVTDILIRTGRNFP
eukprot:gene9614-19979_t